MDVSLVFQASVSAPQTHAIIIGAGRYPYLKNGGGAHTINAKGMGQLTTSTLSARAFAKWLLDPVDGFNNPERPLGSVRVLLSEKTSSPLLDSAGAAVLGPNGQPFIAPRADLATIKTAVAAWFDALNKHPDDLAIFFFSGHGVVAGLEQAILPSDFGSEKLSPYAGAIRFDGFHLGMAKAASREQCYFIDACRAYSREFDLGREFAGHPLISVTPEDLENVTVPRSSAIFNATLAGEKAYGPKDAPSFFTEALLKAVEGAGAISAEEEGVWRIQTGALNNGMDFLIGRIKERHNFKGVQVGSAALNQFYLHKLRLPPRVPVKIDCVPAGYAGSTKFSHDDHPLDVVGPPLLPVGAQKIKAVYKGPPALEDVRERTVWPPYVTFQMQFGGR